MYYISDIIHIEWKIALLQNWCPPMCIWMILTIILVREWVSQWETICSWILDADDMLLFLPSIFFWASLLTVYRRLLGQLTVMHLFKTLLNEVQILERLQKKCSSSASRILLQLVSGRLKYYFNVLLIGLFILRYSSVQT